MRQHGAAFLFQLAYYDTILTIHSAILQTPVKGKYFIADFAQCHKDGKEQVMAKQLQSEIIKLIQENNNEEKLKIIYHFIRGLMDGAEAASLSEK